MLRTGNENKKRGFSCHGFFIFLTTTNAIEFHQFDFYQFQYGE